MMNRAKGPPCHKKYKDQWIISKELRGVDREATLCKSGSDGRIYGHGSFSLYSLKILFWVASKNITDYMVMGSKADDCDLFREMKR